MRLEVSTQDAPPPSWAYSQGIVANGFLSTAGQTPHDAVTDETVGVTIEEQTVRAMENPAAVLAAHGLDLSHVVKTTVHLHHPGRDSAGFNAVYEQFVTNPSPVRTTVGSYLGDFLVEIDAIAVVPADRGRPRLTAAGNDTGPCGARRHGRHRRGPFPVPVRNGFSVRWPGAR